MSLQVLSHTLRKRNSAAVADHTHRIDGSPAANRRESQLFLHFLCCGKQQQEYIYPACLWTRESLVVVKRSHYQAEGKRRELAEDVLRGLCLAVSDGRIDGHLSVGGLGLREQRSPFSSPLSSRLKGIDFALETFPEPFLWSPIANWGSGTSCSFLLPFILQVIARKNFLDAERDHQSLLGHLPVALAWKHLLAT